MDVKELTKKYKDYVIEKRRYLHANPELSGKEFETSKLIQEEMKKLNIPYQVVCETGVIATIKGAHPGKTVLLRADMDALEVFEANDVPYKSKVDGVMHACGHDGHTAMLLGAAQILNELKDQLLGSVVLFFQKSEETASGAKDMVKESKILDKVDAAFAIHLWQGVESGKVSIESGPRMAAADMFSIKIKGKGGHGSMPNETIDAVVVASSIVMNLQHLVSRNTSPLDSLVISVGKMDVGTRFNAIAGDGEISGTSRSFTNEVWEDIPNKIKRVVDGVCLAYGAEASMYMQRSTPPLINNEEVCDVLHKSQSKLYGEDSITLYERTTGGEDFAYITQEVPSALAFVGTRNEKKGINSPHHSSTFDIDEEALEVGTGLYAQFALDFLEEYKNKDLKK